MALTIELPEAVEAALNKQAHAKGLSAAGYACRVLEDAIAPGIENGKPLPPFKTGRGMFAKYGPAPTEEEIDANRADMLRNFPRDFE